MSNNKKSIDWYNDNAIFYTDHVRSPKESIYHSYYEKPAMYNALPNLKGKKVLSLGCGSGEDSHYLKNMFDIKLIIIILVGHYLKTLEIVLL